MKMCLLLDENYNSIVIKLTDDDLETIVGICAKNLEELLYRM